jgi:hypothetical protein
VALYALNGTATGKTLPLLYSAVAGTWSNLSANANIVPVVANGKVYVASDQLLTIFGPTPNGLQAQPLSPLVTARPLVAAPTGSRVYGTMTGVNENHIIVGLRSGKSVSVDLTDALKQYQTVIPFVDEHVQVDGTFASDGSLIATSMQATKEPATWGPDTWRPAR